MGFCGLGLSRGTQTSSSHSLFANGFREMTSVTSFPAPANIGTAPLQSRSFTTWWLICRCPSHAHHMPITRLSYAHHTPITCPSHAHHTPITCPSHAHHMPITCLSHAHHMPITRLSHAHHTPITCPSHAHHMPITHPSMDDPL